MRLASRYADAHVPQPCGAATEDTARSGQDHGNEVASYVALALAPRDRGISRRPSWRAQRRTDSTARCRTSPSTVVIIRATFADPTNRPRSGRAAGNTRTACPILHYRHGAISFDGEQDPSSPMGLPVCPLKDFLV